MIPAPVMHVLATMALLCSLSLEPVTPIPPEPMPAAMTAGAVWAILQDRDRLAGAGLPDRHGAFERTAQ